MKLFTRFAALWVLALLVGATAFAQTTASLSGTATSEGKPLPGVSVTISSPNLQGTRTAVTVSEATVGSANSSRPRRPTPWRMRLPIL